MGNDPEEKASVTKCPPKKRSSQRSENSHQTWGIYKHGKAAYCKLESTTPCLDCVKSTNAKDLCGLQTVDSSYKTTSSTHNINQIDPNIAAAAVVLIPLLVATVAAALSISVAVAVWRQRPKKNTFSHLASNKKHLGNRSHSPKPQQASKLNLKGIFNNHQSRTKATAQLPHALPKRTNPTSRSYEAH